MEKKKWSFILFPLPRGKWKGHAWESGQSKLAPVTGEWLSKGILLSLDDPFSGQHYELHLLTNRQAWRSAEHGPISGGPNGFICESSRLTQSVLQALATPERSCFSNLNWIGLPGAHSWTII